MTTADLIISAIAYVMVGFTLGRSYEQWKRDKTLSKEQNDERSVATGDGKQDKVSEQIEKIVILGI